MTARNNQDRLGGPSGAVESQDAPPPVKTETGSDLLSFVLPTEFVELPSRGEFYPPDHPLHKKDTVEIKFMTARHEDILTSPALLKQGVAVDRLLKELIIDKTIDYDSLLVGDKNALTIGARTTGYGSEYKINVTCPSCLTVGEHGFDLSKLKNVFPEEEELKEFGIERTQENTFFITLPTTKVKIEARLLTGKDEKAIEAHRKMLKKHSGVEPGLTDQLKHIIVSANGETRRHIIEEFVENMPAMDSKFFRVCYAAITPNVEMKQDFSCSACGHEQEVNVPLTAQFFWPGQ